MEAYNRRVNGYVDRKPQEVRARVICLVPTAAAVSLSACGAANIVIIIIIIIIVRCTTVTRKAGKRATVVYGRTMTGAGRDKNITNNDDGCRRDSTAVSVRDIVSRMALKIPDVVSVRETRPRTIDAYFESANGRNNTRRRRRLFEKNATNRRFVVTWKMLKQFFCIHEAADQYLLSTIRISKIFEKY